MSASLPSRWAPDADVRATHWLKRLQWLIDKGMFWVPLATATFVAKLAVPPLAGMGISIAIPAMLAMLGIGLLLQRAEVEPRAMAAYLFTMGFLLALQTLAESRVSMMSVMLLAVLHLPYAFRMTHPPRYDRVIRAVQAVGLTVALLGIVQYAMQFVVGPALAFPMENFFPQAFIVDMFNQQAVIRYGEDVYRANGMVMVEPSVFSQLMAICILIEVMTRKRWFYIGVATLAMFLSYSGTGVVLLLASLGVLALVRGKIALLLGLCAAGCLVVALATVVGNIPYLSVFVARASELGSTGSSGFARFVGGYYLFEQYLWPDPVRTLVGYGAGTFKYYMASAAYPVSEMAIFKVIFEFGLLGTLVYFGFLAYCLFRSAAPFALRAAIAICLLLSGNYFPFAHSLAFVLLVWVDPHYRSARLLGTAPA